MFPKKPHSFYHLSKVHDTNNIEFVCRNWNLSATDLNQGVVYGFHTDETRLDDRLQTSFHYDEVFGTVINRFITQALIGQDLTVYGKGGQKRGYLNINDTLKCVQLAAENKAQKSEFRVFNQYTETLTINDIAKLVKESLDKETENKISIKKIKNPRNEMEEHYYNPTNSGLISLGLKPLKFDKKLICEIYKNIKYLKKRINRNLILPTIKWQS